LGFVIPVFHQCYSQDIHPRPENSPDARVVSDVLYQADIKSISKDLRGYKDFFQSGQTTDTIGARSGPEGSIIGDVTAATIVDSSILVLDQEYGEVKRYSINGTYKGTFGRPGTGPGELATPRDFDVGPNGAVWVLDADRTVSVFNRTDTGYVSTKTFTITHHPQKIESCNGKVYIYGDSPGTSASHSQVTTIHEYSVDGSHIRSFGPYYQSNQIILSRSLSKASGFECLSGRHLFVDYRYLPYSILIGIDNKRNEWKIKYSRQKTIDVRMTRSNGNPEVRFSSPDDGTVFGTSSSVIESNYVVVNKGTKDFFEVYIADTDSKKALKVGDYKEEWLYVDGDLSLRSVEAPYPIIKIIKFD